MVLGAIPTGMLIIHFIKPVMVYLIALVMRGVEAGFGRKQVQNIDLYYQQVMRKIGLIIMMDMNADPRQHWAQFCVWRMVLIPEMDMSQL